MAELSAMDRKIEKKWWTKKRLASYSAILIFVVLMIYALLSTAGGSRLNVKEETLIISTVEKGPFKEFIPVSGTILPIKTIYLDPAEGGRVEEVFLEEGSLVEQGDSILKLANTNLHLDIMYREAELYQQINNLRNTRLDMERHRLAISADLLEINYQLQQNKREYERLGLLHEKNLVSKQEFEDVADAYNYWLRRKELTVETQRQDSILRAVQIEQLEASVARMEDNLQVVKQKMENLLIRAPVSGQLTSLNAEIGESKRPGERLGQVDVLVGFKVRAAIDEYYITRINKGQIGEFTLAEKTYRLVVKKIFTVVRDGRFDVDLEFVDAEPEGIRRGQTLQIRLELGSLSEAILLPRGGFWQQTGGRWVYVVDESGDIARKRYISLGLKSPLYYEVLSGLEPGERVITSSYDNFGDVDQLILKN
ncbi:MAG: HlyD family efflux transporter periplasmic adaptor subunit [Candidatus Zixiibacteriota bacterium]|nr:MAG: HlyD family efflux transporter periplasmic adaptor subunit [candidate division Zixibacteria bacterium]